MRTRKLRLAIALFTLLAGGWWSAPAARAASGPRFRADSGPTFIVTVGSAFALSAPSPDAPPVFSVFQNQALAIIGRGADGVWLRLEVRGGVGWLPAQYGTVQGSLADVPVTTAGPESPATPVIGPPAPAPSRPAEPTAAGQPVWFTLAVKSVYGRSGPSLTSALAASLFRGQTYRVRGRLADNSWLSIDYAGAPEVWVLPAYGTVAGNLDGVPVLLPPATAPVVMTPAPPAPGALAVADLIRVGSRAREIYQRGLQLGNDPHVFSRIGDCSSAAPDFLGAFDNPQAYRLGGPYADLRATISNFAGSFARQSPAAVAGFSAAAVLDPDWADPRLCLAGESPVACEYRLARPSLAFISLGTNSTWESAAGYETDLRTIIQDSIDRGIVPILSTKADNLEGDDHMNVIVARLAAEYDIPVWQFALAARGLPDQGLGADRYHLTWGLQVFDDPQNLKFGWQWRNVTGLQALDAVWRAVR